jgi:hypothetical protein
LDRHQNGKSDPDADPLHCFSHYFFHVKQLPAN